MSNVFRGPSLLSAQEEHCPILCALIPSGYSLWKHLTNPADLTFKQTAILRFFDMSASYTWSQVRSVYESQQPNGKDLSENPPLGQVPYWLGGPPILGEYSKDHGAVYCPSVKETPDFYEMPEKEGSTIPIQILSATGYYDQFVIPNVPLPNTSYFSVYYQGQSIANLQQYPFSPRVFQLSLYLPGYLGGETQFCIVPEYTAITGVDSSSSDLGVDGRGFMSECICPELIMPSNNAASRGILRSKRDRGQWDVWVFLVSICACP